MLLVFSGQKSPMRVAERSNLVLVASLPFSLHSLILVVYMCGQINKLRLPLHLLFVSSLDFRALSFSWRQIWQRFRRHWPDLEHGFRFGRRRWSIRDNFIFAWLIGF
ncbi:uncharacterized protein K444DRAFT_303882 [Hyaloscypha bicolor E]|uniref:Uncharacterized protein n=1 Tax=Hyaloscypha bicolor E TaxID=1095630 RepID=A0A2J6TN24_9HELO|nr:uncharacterized protein K444DRAFT_303882 [Hyaloscypha bicolor E]PMD64421.1 hypothetical protein K444DRAFT_303882 [Hyaloscypha bicolor E]